MTARFAVAGGAAATTKVTPGSSFGMDVRLDAPATATIGAAFRAMQAVPASPSNFFPITARDFTASIYDDASSGTPDPTALALPSALLNPDNDDNLGRNTVGLADAATGANLFVERITFSVDPGTPLATYTIKPNSGGTSAVTDTAFTSYDRALTASFDVVVGEMLTVTKSGTGTGSVTSDVGLISCGATCSDVYPGSTVTLTATPSVGSTFAGWSGGGCSGTGACKVRLSAMTTVNAEFAAAGCFLNISVIPPGAGMVTSTPPAISCSFTCSIFNATGTVYTLTATPAVGWTFAGWSASCSGTGTCVAGCGSLTATFSLPQFNLTVTKSGAGAGTVTSAPPGISCGGACTAPFAPGTVVTLTAASATGSAFAGWSGGVPACSGTGTCTVTMNQAQSVAATFDIMVPPPAAITAIPTLTEWMLLLLTLLVGGAGVFMLRRRKF